MAPPNSTDRSATAQAVILAAVSRATARAVPVSRSEEKGTAAGTDTVTASGQVVRRCSSIDPVAASSSGLPSGRVRTGTRPATSWRAFTGLAFGAGSGSRLGW